MDANRTGKEDNKEETLSINNRKLVIIAAAGLLVIGLTAGFILGLFGSPVPVTEQADQTDEAEDIATEKEFENGEVIAIINDKEVTRAEFNQAMEQRKMEYAMHGIDLESEDMAELLKEVENEVIENFFVIPIILEQKAQQEDITITTEEIEERLLEYKNQFGGREKLEEQMQSLNLSREDLEKEIVRELSLKRYLDNFVEKYLEKNPDQVITKEDLAIDPAEVKQYYKQILDTYNELSKVLEENTPGSPREQVEIQRNQIEERYGYILEADEFTDVKTSLEEQMKERKLKEQQHQQEQDIFFKHIEELREQSKINIKL